MKKILSLWLAMILAFSSMLSLVSCGSNNDEKINLTLSNYEDYISIDSARVYGTGSPTWSSYLSAYQYPNAEGSVSISGVYGYEYTDVVIDITIHFHYGDDYHEMPISVNLNKGGNGRGSNIEKLKGFGWANEWIQKHAYYEVTSVKGYVSKA